MNRIKLFKELDKYTLFQFDEKKYKEEVKRQEVLK